MKKKQSVSFWAGAIMAASIAAICIISFFWMPADPEKMDTLNRFALPSAAHLLGTDQFGRDVLSRIMEASRWALLVGVCSVTVGALAGSIIGASAAMLKGAVRAVIMRFIDGMMSFPGILLAMMLVTVLGKGILGAVLAIGLFMVPTFSRLVYSMVLENKQRLYIKAAHSYGCSGGYTSGAWRGIWQGEGGGLLMTQASHQLDLMQWICGMPVSVLARCSTIGRPIQVENEAELFLTYLNGAHGHFIASAHECPGTNLLEICGTRGRISVRDDSEVEIIRLEEDERTFARSCPSPFEQVSGTVERLTFDDRNNKAQQAATIQNFVAAAQGAGPIQCSLEEGLRSLQIIHGAYLSHWMGRTVTLPGDERVFCRILNRTGASMAIGHGPL